SATQGSYDSASGVWGVGGLVPGAGATLTITALVNAGTSGRTITSTALISAVGQPDPNPSNNRASAIVTVQVLADLAVSAAVDDVSPIEGQTVHYTVTVDDRVGPQGATGVRVTDLLPAGLTFISASATRGGYDSASGVWAVGDLAAAASAVLTVTATLN